MNQFVKRAVIGASIVVTLVLGVFVILRLSGVLLYFKMVSGSSEPNLKVGERVFASGLKAPKVNDFICFAAYDSINNRADILMHRLCAKGGDKVEIKDGVLIVNGMPETGIKLTNEYLVPRAYLPKIPNTGEVNNVMDMGEDSVHVFATVDFMKENGIVGKLVVHPVAYVDEMVALRWQHNWNLDQFGPVVVPADCYFVLGDNRHNAFDSRYRGFVDGKDFRATVVWHK